MGTRRFGGRLQVEIVASLFVVMLAGLAIVAVMMGSLAVRTIEREAVERLQRGARSAQALLATGPGRLSDLAAVLRTFRARDLEGTYTVHDLEGRRISFDGRRKLPGPERLGLIRDAQESGDLVSGGGLPPTDLVLVVPLTTPRGERGVLVGVVSAEELRARLAPWFHTGAWVLGAAAVVFVVFGSYLLRRRIVRPVLALSVASRRIAEGDLAVRMPAEGSDELAELAARFSDMAASLERQRDALIEAQTSLARSERLASIGRLAAGVAHEVGNPVAAILGYAQVVSRTAGLSEGARDTVGRITDEALRIRTLIRELLDLARSSQLRPRACSPESLIERVVERLRPQPLLAGIDLQWQPGAPLPEVEADADRVEQVLVNLVENAAHAVAKVPAPRIQIVARVAPRPDRPTRRKGDPPAASFEARRCDGAVAIDVVDNGPGIDSDDIERVFDPFFTTKDPGCGTGLGLWNGHRIAELLDGKLEASSRPGHTRFSLILPATDRKPADGQSTGSDHR